MSESKYNRVKSGIVNDIQAGEKEKENRAEEALLIVRNILRRIHENPRNGELYRHCADALRFCKYSESKYELNQLRKWIGVGIESGADPQELSYALRNSYMWSGRYSFNDYMTACEWTREGKAKFYAPRRKILEDKLRIVSQIQAFIDDPDAMYLGFSLPPGAGKAIVNDADVYTRSGWKKHGELCVGDEVIAPSGAFVKVTNVFPKVMCDRYVEFQNGEIVECHANHEWKVYDCYDATWRTLETGAMQQRFGAYRYCVPTRVNPLRTDDTDTENRFGSMIKAIGRIEPKQGNCIEVEGGMYCVGRAFIPTHNSTLIKFLLAFIMGREPDSANMYVSYSDGMSKIMLDSVKSILTDCGEYRHNDIFPTNGVPDVSTEYRTISYRRKGDFPTLSIVSMGGSVTGRTRANRFLVTDDLVANSEVARSTERLQRLWEDYTTTITTRMIGDEAKQIMLGTRWSVHDPIGHMLSIHEGDPRYKFISIPVCDEEGHSNFCYEHPDNYTDERIQEIKSRLDPVEFSCLYMQKGIEKEGLAFPEDSLRYYNGVLPPSEPDNVLFFVDVAWGGGDSLAMPIAYVYGDDVYIHDVVFDKRQKEETIPVVAGRVIQHKCKMGRFEANNGGDMYCDEVSRKLKQDNYSINIGHKKAPTNMSKISRIEQHSGTIKSFYFLDLQHRTDEYKKFMAEVCSFSYTTKNLHDDAPDSLAGLCDFMYNRMSVVEVRKRLF